MGKGTHENVSEFQVQVKSMSYIIPVTRDAILILLSLVTTLIKSLKKCVPSTAIQTLQS